eukprot:11252392-Prorocentrum_lima.AAC.1
MERTRCASQDHLLHALCRQGQGAPSANSHQGDSDRIRHAAGEGRGRHTGGRTHEAPPQQQ